MSETILNLGLGALALALIGYGMSSMGPTHLDYQVAKACYSASALLMIILLGVWSISVRSSMGRRVLIAFIICGAIGAVWATLIGIAQNREEAQSQKEAKKAYTGKLQPEIKVILSAKEHIYPRLEIGDSGSIFKFTGPKGEPLLNFLVDNDIIIEIEDNQTKLSTKIRDKNNNIIAEIIKNEWKIKPNNIWDRNYTNDAIEVIDSSGDVVLQVQLLDDRIRFQGKLYKSDGNRVGFWSKGLHSGGTIIRTDNRHPEMAHKINDFKIKPLFKYPSELHLGEFVNGK